MAGYTTFMFSPFGGFDDSCVSKHAMVLSEKHIEKSVSYVICRHEGYVELLKVGYKRDSPKVVLSVFDIVKSESGEPTVSVTRNGPHTSPGGILYHVHSPFHKTLYIGDASYQWRSVSTGLPGSITWYELQGLDGSMIAHLRVEEGVIKYNLVPEIKHRSPLCVGIVTAIVLMSLMRDPWLAGSDVDFWGGMYGPN